MPATFIGIVIPYLVSKPMWASVITAGTVSIMAGGLPHKLGLMVAALATCVTRGLFKNLLLTIVVSMVVFMGFQWAFAVRW